MRVNKTIVIAVAIAAAAGLGACGSAGHPGASGSYCKELKADKAYFRSFEGDNPDITKLDEAFTRLHSLAGSAPAATATEWRQVDGTITKIQQAMDEAGVSFADLVAMQQGEIPDGVDLDKVGALGPKLEALSGGQLDKAASAIDQDARKHCGFALSSS